MLRLKALQHLDLLLLLARRLPLLLLPLIIHHFLDHAPRFPIQIAQLAILRRDLRGVDFGGRGDDVRPPFHFVGFVEVEVDGFAAGGGDCGGGEGPGGFVGVDGVGKGALRWWVR